jgi:hypothetical protein
MQGTTGEDVAHAPSFSFPEPGFLCPGEVDVSCENINIVDDSETYVGQNDQNGYTGEWAPSVASADSVLDPYTA